MEIIKIELKNFLGYRDEIFDFENINGIILIGGKNGNGKSSILDAISYCLSGRVRNIYNKSINNEDVIYIDENNKKVDYCCVTIYFIFLNIKYRIIRKVRKNGGSDLQFHIWQEDMWNSLTLQADINKRTGKRESSITRTENIIFEVLGCNVNLLINSSIFEQGNTDLFAKATVDQRKVLFKDAAFINKWEDYASDVKERLNVVSLKLNTLDTLLSEYDGVELMKLKIFNNKSEVKVLGGKLHLMKSSQLEIQKKIEILTEECGKIESKKKKFDSCMLDINKNKIELEGIEETINDCKKSLLNTIKLQNVINKNIQEGDKYILTLKAVINKYKDDKVDIDYEKFGNLKTEKIQVQMHLSLNEDDVNILKCEKDKVSIIICPVGMECKYISDEVKMKKVKEINSTIFKLNKVRSTLNKQLNICSIKNDDIQLLINENDQIQKYLDDNYKKLESKKLNINDCHLELERLNSKILILNSETKRCSNDHIKVYKKIIELGKMNEMLKGEIFNFKIDSERLSQLKVDNYDITIRVEKTLKEIAFKEHDTIQLKGMLNKYEDLKKQSMVLMDEKIVVSYSLKMLGKDIPHILISNVIPEVEDNANKFLNKISDSTMFLELRTEKELLSKDEEGEQVKRDTLELWLIVNGKRMKYSLCSGGERLRADIALHLGYSEFLLSKSNCQLEDLFMDEISSALDQDGKDSLIDILNELHHRCGFKKVMIISHDGYLKKQIDKYIEIEKTEEGSKIKLWRI